MADLHLQGSEFQREALLWGAHVLREYPFAHQLDEYDGVPVEQLSGMLGTLLLAYDELPSTQDAAHLLAAAGAPGGTLIVADRQLAGRGRQGRQWRSEQATGVWVTRLDRPTGVHTLGVLSLRIGLMLAERLQRLADSPVGVKWPNDVFVGSGKLAGVLVEARWRDDRPEWVAAGVGVNVSTPPDVELQSVGSLRSGVSRAEVLEVVGAVLVDAATLENGDVLSGTELNAWERRDVAAGARCVLPLPGEVLGISADGALRVRDDEGVERMVRAGSLQLENDQLRRGGER